MNKCPTHCKEDSCYGLINDKVCGKCIDDAILPVCAPCPLPQATSTDEDNSTIAFCHLRCTDICENGVCIKLGGHCSDEPPFAQYPFYVWIPVIVVGTILFLIMSYHVCRWIGRRRMGQTDSSLDSSGKLIITVTPRESTGEEQIDSLHHQVVTSDQPRRFTIGDNFTYRQIMENIYGHLDKTATQLLKDRGRKSVTFLGSDEPEIRNEEEESASSIWSHLFGGPNETSNTSSDGRSTFFDSAFNSTELPTPLTSTTPPVIPTLIMTAPSDTSLRSGKSKSSSRSPIKSTQSLVRSTTSVKSNVSSKSSKSSDEKDKSRRSSIQKLTSKTSSLISSKKSPETQMASANTKRLSPEITQRITSKSSPQLTPKMKPDLTQRITSKSSPQLTPEMTPVMTRRIASKSSSQSSQLTPEMTPDLTRWITSKSSPQLRPKMTPDMTRQIKSKSSPELSPEMKPDLTRRMSSKVTTAKTQNFKSPKGPLPSPVAIATEDQADSTLSSSQVMVVIRSTQDTVTSSSQDSTKVQSGTWV